METKHTPGPWRLSETMRDAVVCDSDSGHDRNDAVTYYGGHLIAESIFREADRRLIAAAPLLLDVLQRVVAMWDHHADAHGDGVASPLHEAARAAIAAATN